MAAACGSSGDSGSGSNQQADSGDQTFQLTLHEYQAENHPFYVEGVVPFAEQVEKESDGRIEVELFAGQTLGAVADQLETARSGTADIVNTVADYIAEQMPLSGVMNTYTPSVPLAIENSQAAWELCHTDPFLAEIKAQGMHPLACFAITPYEIFTKEPITNIPEDLAGLRVRSAGGLQEEFVRALGMEPVGMPSPELYQALERGTIDGASFLWYALTPHSIQEQVNYGTEGIGVIPTGVVFYFMPTEVWESMPEDLQKVLYDAGKQMSYNIGTALDEDDAEVKAEIVPKDVELREVTDEERQQLGKMTAPVIDAWVAEMEGLGLGDEARKALAAVEAIEGEIDPELPVSEWEDYFEN